MVTIQDKFIEVYHRQTNKTDKERYISAVVDFEKEFELRAPYGSYNSFKNAHSNRIKTRN